MTKQTANKWDSQALVGASAMTLLGVGFCSTAVMLVWPNSDGEPTEEAETLTASIGAQEEVNPLATPTVEIPSEGVVYWHPDYGQNIIIIPEGAAQ